MLKPKLLQWLITPLIILFMSLTAAFAMGAHSSVYAKVSPPGSPSPSPPPSSPPPQPTASPSALQKSLQGNPIVKNFLQPVVDFLSAAVALVITGSIIFAGIRYSTAGDQPDAVVAARNRIIDSSIALIAFLLIFAFVQWLIPGGLFG